jgi:hypothetical protein
MDANKIFLRMSGVFLTEYLYEPFLELDREEQLDVIENQKAAMFQHLSAADILELIRDATYESTRVESERIAELEQWIAGISDDHPEIPDWIQGSARHLLAEGVKL